MYLLHDKNNIFYPNLLIINQKVSSGVIIGGKLY